LASIAKTSASAIARPRMLRATLIARPRSASVALLTFSPAANPPTRTTSAAAGSCRRRSPGVCVIRAHRTDTTFAPARPAIVSLGPSPFAAADRRHPRLRLARRGVRSRRCGDGAPSRWRSSPRDRRIAPRLPEHLSDVTFLAGVTPAAVTTAIAIATVGNAHAMTRAWRRAGSFRGRSRSRSPYVVAAPVRAGDAAPDRHGRIPRSSRARGSPRSRVRLAGGRAPSGRRASAALGIALARLDIRVARWLWPPDAS
jgi:hypothetical protein